MNFTFRARWGERLLGAAVARCRFLVAAARRPGGLAQLEVAPTRVHDTLAADALIIRAGWRRRWVAVQGIVEPIIVLHEPRGRLPGRRVRGSNFGGGRARPVGSEG